MMGRLQRRISGALIDDTGRDVYDGIFEPGHPAAKERGSRRDALRLAHALASPQSIYLTI